MQNNPRRKNTDKKRNKVANAAGERGINTHQFKDETLF